MHALVFVVGVNSKAGCHLELFSEIKSHKSKTSILTVNHGRAGGSLWGRRRVLRAAVPVSQRDRVHPGVLRLAPWLL